jgi:hypothetical protein
MSSQAQDLHPAVAHVRATPDASGHCRVIRPKATSGQACSRIARITPSIRAKINFNDRSRRCALKSDA